MFVKPIYVLSLLLSCAIILGCGGGSDKQSSSSNTSQSASSVSTKQEASTPEQKLKLLSKKSIEGYGGTLVNFQTANVTNDGSGNYNVVVSCNGKILPDHKGTVAEYEIAAKRLAKDVYASGLNINVVGLDMICPVVNKQTGANVDLHAWGVFIRKDAAKKVKDWEGVDLKKLVDKSDYKQHAVLR